MKAKNYSLPDLKKAKVRTRNTVAIERSVFDMNEELRRLGLGKKYYIRTYGCQANERDSETLAGIFEAIMFTPADNYEEADVILFNTCAIRQNAEDKVFGEIGSIKKLKEKYPEKVYALCGCMAQEEEVIEQIKKTYRQVDLVFGTHNLHRLPNLLGDVMLSHQRVFEVYSKEGDVIENLPVKRFGKYKAWVNIMYGCNKFCTYCIVPYTRGKERSRLKEDILKEVEQ